MKNLAIILVLFLNLDSPMNVRVKENSMIPKIVGKMIGNDKYAITVGKTIYISCDIDTFLEDTDWVKHEMTHIIQYRKHGTVDFLVKYLRYSLHYSYRNNPFEKEAFSVEK